MERIKDGRRNILIHENATEDDLPVENLPELPGIEEEKSFVPINMDDPKLYSGDVIVGVYDGEIRFAELIVDKISDGVLVVPLDTGKYTIIRDPEFSSRFFNAEEIHIYDSVTTEEAEEWDTEFDESKLTRPDPKRAR